MGQNDTNGASCKTTCWLAALVAGVLVAALLMWMRDYGFLSAVFWGLVILLVGGFALNWAFCGNADAQVSSAPAATPTDGTTAAAPLASTGAATTSAPVAENAAAASTLSAAPAAAISAKKVNPSATLAGEGDVASRKGDWKDETEAKTKAPAKKTAAKKPAAKKAVTTKTAAKSSKSTAATAKPVAKPKAAPKAKAADAKPTAKAKPALKAKAAPAAKPAAKAKSVAADGKPELLKKARAGGADDLKQIKGVGPKLEGQLHKSGVFHFDQVASWRKKEVEWADSNLEGVKGRVSRDEWVKQAKVLAKGGETEFSKKVKKGGVY